MEKINILCSADNNYAAYCGIMLTTLYENNKNCDIAVYLLTDGLNEAEIKKFRQFEQRYETEIHIITVRRDSFKHCPVREGDHVSLTAYYRIACAELLPDTLEKILYLDCDIMVKCDLRQLWNYDVTGKAMGVVIDGWHIANEQRLKFNSKTYFNSGVLLINLEFFRTNRIAEKCMNYIHDFPEIIKLHDQDALNIICHNELLYLPLKYNFQTSFLRIKKTFDKDLSEEIISSLEEKDLMVHFDAFPKPWSRFLYVDHPYTSEWREYRKRSLWSDARIISPSSKVQVLRIMLFRLFWKMGIKNRPQEYIL